MFKFMFTSSTKQVKHLKIPLQELSDASDSFSEQNVIARGGFGNVYKGVSVKHGNIAIKMLDPRLGQGDHEFSTEIALLSVYKHENIVSFLGFCDEDGKKILVYKYESNGSLDKHLTNPDLTWIQRLQICLDAARGLQYLHDDVGSEKRTIHRDVKSSNILLDENWKAKISDFGLSRMGPANSQSTFLISNACGTFGYIDPDYLNTGFLTQKSDVYSFGVVLFEVLCGRRTRVPSYKGKQEFLINLVRIHWRKKTLDEIIYSDIKKQINRASLHTFSSIAYQCLMSPNERPTMKKVVKQLQKALDNQQASIDLWSNDDHGVSAHLQGNFEGSLASSSHSSSSYSSSFSHSWLCDVFINSFEQGTPLEFEYRLYKNLVNRDVITYTYRDYDYMHDDDVIHMESSTKAIQGSRIAIIVFSSSHFASYRCFDDLASVMNNMDERGQIVIPIFYGGVTPSDVRLQKGSFECKFAEYEQDEYHKYKVESWREALVKVADLPGWDVSHETMFEQIPKIVERISKELLRLMHETSAYTNLIGIQVRMQELKSLLKVDTDGVQKVAISGMSGSGKSTLAFSIYDEISHEFDGCCFVKDVTDRSRRYGLKTIQEEILSNVLKSKVTLTNFKQGRDEIERRLSQNKVLIVLDDIEHFEAIEMLVGSRKWFGDGSRIIITTSNQRLAKSNGFLTHNVRMLDVKESIELFSSRAFGESIPLQGFEEVSLNMVSKLGGHPLALIRLGSFLHGKDKSLWMRVLDRLQGIPDNEILYKFLTPNDGLPTNRLLDFLLEACWHSRK